MANVASPGDYVVVMMGMNQTALAPGEIVRVTMRRLAEGADAQNGFDITHPTLSSAAGAVVPSEVISNNPAQESEKPAQTPASEPPGTSAAKPAVPQSPAATAVTAKPAEAGTFQNVPATPSGEHRVPTMTAGTPPKSGAPLPPGETPGIAAKAEARKSPAGNGDRPETTGQPKRELSGDLGNKNVQSAVPATEAVIANAKRTTPQESGAKQIADVGGAKTVERQVASRVSEPVPGNAASGARETKNPPLKKWPIAALIGVLILAGGLMMAKRKLVAMVFPRREDA